MPPFFNESEWRWGLQGLWDGRDNTVETRHGYYLRWGFYALPSDGQTGFGTGVGQAELDARYFGTVLGNAVLAGRVNAAFTSGNPSYSFEYSLGGLDELRGFHTNRFRGTQFYGAQGELRFPIVSFLWGSTSLDLGDATDGVFGTPLASWQVGIRSMRFTGNGLVLRVDSGFGKDGMTTILSANEPF